MAKISAGEQFGHSVAEPVRQPVIPQDAFGFVDRWARRVDQQINQAEHEVDQADRARATRIVTGAELDFREAAVDLADRVQQGKLPKEEANSEWASLSSDIKQRLLDGAPAKHSAEIAAVLSDKARATELGVIRSAVRDRARSEQAADLAATMENLQRRDDLDRHAAATMADEQLDSLGPGAGLDAKQISAAKQTFREQRALVDAKRLVRGARDDLKALGQAEKTIGGDSFSDLTPQAREQVETQITNHRARLEHQQEVARARAEAAYERRVRSAERAVDTLQGMIDGGGVPDDATLSTVQGLTAGTPLAPMLRTLVGQAKDRANFGSLTPEQQRATLLQLRAKANQGTSPDGWKRLQTFETIAAKQADVAAQEPLKWALGTRLLDQVQPLAFENVDQLGAQLAGRVQQAQEVGAALKRPVSPLLGDEARRMAEMITAMPAPMQARALGNMAARLPAEQQRALAAQIEPKDRSLSLAMFASTVPAMVSTDVPGMLLRGADARRTGRLKSAADDPVAARDQATIAQQLAAVPWPTPQARDAAVEAAQLLYDAQRDAKKSGSVREAIKLATGGGLTDWADAKVPMPPGWDEDRFRRRMRSMDAAAIQRQANGLLYAAGAEVRPEAIAKALGAATLVPMGPGKYAVQTGGALVTLGTGRPLVLDLARD